MTLYLVGINHFDPSCRLKLCDWFCQCIEKGLRTPCFVAVEWDPEVFEQVRSQRKKFRELLREQWPSMSETLLETLTLSLAYEGDTHTAYYPEAGTLWLDESREVDTDEVNNYGRDRFNMYKRFLNAVPAGSDDGSILQGMREAAIQEAAPMPQQGNARDEKFATHIIQRIEKNECDWAIVVVGKNHAGDFKGSMRRLLEEKGYCCKVLLL